ncbi:DUF6168 family protein [Tenacibaculum sp. SZ-18]|uniref:DUF6168 family protein n=1 Tax=Tenacibaculum sp. SZ-18 TaxID=754423 RepID=UPI000C2D14D3|nr:DUF6168 family protein [Tenacibaculum sp. SZ-18]
MIKRILLFLTALFLVFIISYFLNSYLVVEETFAFSLLSVYLFHTIAAFVVYCAIEIAADYMPNQAGYTYLASIFLKMGFFVLVFNSSVFANGILSKPEKFSLVAPLFLFLITEAVAVSKLLNSK